MNRRDMLRSVALASLILAAGCNGTAPPTQDELTRNVNLIATGLSGIVTILRGLPPGSIPPDTLTKAQAIIDDIRTNAPAVGTALAPNPDKVQAIANAVSALSVLLSPFFPVAPVVGGLVQAALVLVPIILTLAGRRPAAAAAPTMTPDQARTTLQNAPKP